MTVLMSVTEPARRFEVFTGAGRRRRWRLETHHESADEPLFGSRGRGRVEIISGGNNRRRWSSQEKARITRESFGPAARVADVARRNGVSQGVLHHWRKKAREAGGGASLFVPVQLDDKKPIPTGAKSVIEIDVGGATIRLNGRVDAEWLRAVVAEIRGTSADHRRAVRQARSAPLMETLHAMLNEDREGLLAGYEVNQRFFEIGNQMGYEKQKHIYLGV